jgi:hypothetical protein
LLLPVNFVGVCQSLRQAVTGAKTPFGRTPKVRGRTAVPAPYLLAELALLTLAAGLMLIDAVSARWLHALFTLVNVMLLGYALIRLIGPVAVLDDLGVPRARPMVPARHG